MRLLTRGCPEAVIEVRLGALDGRVLVALRVDAPGSMAFDCEPLNEVPGCAQHPEGVFLVFKGTRRAGVLNVEVFYR